MSEPAPRFARDEALVRLASAPARIAAACARVPADQLLQAIEIGGWSARDVLGHLRACDRTWGGYIERILDEDHPAFRGESPRSTIRRMDVLTVPFGVSLEAFTADRVRLVARLRAADAATLARTASVTLPGRGTEERSAAYYADRLADHEDEHVRHIEREMAARPAPT